MNELRFTVEEWTAPGHGPREESATNALFSIQSDGVSLTRNDSSWSRSVSNRVHVSLYPAALWLAANWWRLCFEARGADYTIDYDWRAAHELAAAGRGYLWPSLVIVPDGECVSLKCHPTRTASKQPIRYLEDSEVLVSLRTFQQACDELIDTVVGRLREEKVGPTDLQDLWHEITAERADPSTSRARRFEAMMHCDPDEAPADGLAALDRLADEAGLAATNELAGALRRADATEVLRRLTDAASNGAGARGGWKPDEELRARCQALATDTSLQPWKRGLEAARALRAAWRLGDEPIDSAVLEQRLDLPHETLGATAGASALPVSLAIQHASELRWLLRSRHSRSRRFEAARVLGDVIASPLGDTWHPATDRYTARQKFQRAFAAEFLCPVGGLRQLLGSDRSEDRIVAAAEHFDVSELAVEHQVKNHLDLDDN